MFLAWRDFLARYKQTIAGVSWAIVRPIVSMVIFTVVFGELAGLPSSDVPYPILVFAAILPWQVFSDATSASGRSLVNNANLLSKVYLPRIIVPASSIIVSLVDLLLSCVVLAILMVWYNVLPSPRIVALPFFILLAIGLAFGIGLVVSALSTKYRDALVALPFLLQTGMYISPVGFQSGIVPDEWRLLYSLNPMVGIIDGFRWALLEGSDPYWPSLVISIVIIALLLLCAFRLFRKREALFADFI